MLLLWFALTATCPTESRTEAGLRQAEDRWVNALEQRDEASLHCRLAEEFTDNDWRGDVRSRTDMLAALRDRQPSTLNLTDITTRLSGKIGIVRGVNTQTAPDGTIVGKVRFTDIFVYRDRRWQAIAAQETVIAPAR